MTGCCTSCNGTGKAMDAPTNGLCWDCRGTGHPHADEPDPHGVWEGWTDTPHKHMYFPLNGTESPEGVCECGDITE